MEMKLDGTQQAPVAPDTDMLALLGAEDESQLPMLPDQNVGLVQVDAANRRAKVPSFKLAGETSTMQDPNIPFGAFTLDNAIMVSEAKGPNNIHQASVVVLSYQQGYEDVTDLGYRGPKNRYRTLDEIRKAKVTAQGAPATYQRPPKGYEDIASAVNAKPTVRDAALAVLLVEKPAAMEAPLAFPYEFGGKRYALARWFMTGWAVWGPGKCIADNAAQALKLPGIEAGRFLIWAESSVSKGTGKKFFKPCARLEAVPNTKEFVDWVKGLFARVKAEAVAAATAKENEPQPETVTGSPAPTGTPPAV